MNSSYDDCLEIYGDDFWHIKDVEGNTYSMDKRLAVNLLMTLHYRKMYSGDLVIFVDGKEGTGKSTFARQIAKLLDPNFTEKRIIYDFATLKKLYFNDVKWEAIVYDESDEGVNRIETMKKQNVEFAKFMRQSRQAHKILIMCAPSVYDIASYVAQHRIMFLAHCYLEDGVHPGHFAFYNEIGIHKLFLYDKDKREYNQKPVFSGTFTRCETVDLLAYEARKKAAFMKFKDGEHQDVLTPQEVIREFIISRMRNWGDVTKRSRGVTVKDFCAVMQIDRQTFYNYIERYSIVIKDDIVEEAKQEEEEKPSRGYRRTALTGLRKINN